MDRERQQDWAKQITLPRALTNENGHTRRSPCEQRAVEPVAIQGVQAEKCVLTALRTKERSTELKSVASRPQPRHVTRVTGHHETGGNIDEWCAPQHCDRGGC